MYRGPKSILIWLGVICLFSLPAAQAASRYQTRVKVIHASTGPAHVDPGVGNLIREIRPVFKYTRFKMLKEKQMVLSQGREGRMGLPGQRRLVITPTGMQGNRIQYQIRIDAKGTPVFQTGIMLKNKSSVTIGGPRMENGVLLINIHGSMN